jgi:hypothetical protein
MEVIEFDSEDPYVRKYCDYHYIEVKKDLLKCGAKGEVMNLLEVW